MKNKLIKKIFIRENFTDSDDKKSILWTGYSESKNQKSILKYIRDNPRELRSNYLSWVDSIGKVKVGNHYFEDYLKIDSDFSLWWMTHFVEKSNTKTRSHFFSIKFIALISLLKKTNIDKVYCDIADIRLINALEYFCKSNQIRFKANSNIKKININSLKIFHIFKGIFFLLKSFKNNLIHKKVKIKSTNYNKNSLTIFSYFINFKIDAGQIFSNYWTILPRYLNDKNIKINWFHHYVKNKNNIKSELKIIKKLNNDNNFHNLIYNDISLLTFFKILFKWLSLVFRISLVEKELFKKIFNSRNGYLLFFHRDDYCNSFYGTLAIQNIIWVYQFDKILKKIPRQELGLYLCENQSWERALSYYWKKNGHGKLCGVIHSTMPFWDLRYFQDKDSFNVSSVLPVPDYFAVNSPLAKKIYKDSSQPMSMLTEVEALRYLNLNKSTFSNRNKKEFIVLGDYQQNTTLEMLKILQKFRINNNVQITFKPHPGNKINLNKNGFDNITTTDDSIYNLSKKYDFFVTTANTSSSIDLILLRKNFIIYLDQDDFNLSYLNEFKNVDYFYDNQSFDKLITSLPKNLNKIDSNQLLYLDQSLKKWKAFIKDNFNSFQPITK